MIGFFTQGNFAPKEHLVAVIEDLQYRNNLYTKKQQKQFTQKNINLSFTNYTFKYWDTLAGPNVYSSDINDYQILQINPNLETFLELTLKINVGVLAPPPDFDVPVYFVLFDGVDVLQNQIISTLNSTNTILNFTTKANFELITKKETLYYGIFVDTSLTITQKNWIDSNLTLDWSLVINQNQII